MSSAKWGPFWLGPNVFKWISERSPSNLDSLSNSPHWFCLLARIILCNEGDAIPAVALNFCNAWFAALSIVFKCSGYTYYAISFEWLDN